jgi:hypothetical protein
MGENFETDVLLDAIALTKAPVVPNGLDVVDNTIGALGTVAPPLANVVPDVGVGMKVVELVALVYDPVPVPKF